MQQLIIIGNLGKDATTREVNGSTVISFPLAVNESYVDGQGQKHEKTSWYKVDYWKKQGKSTEVAKFLTKGKLVSVVGRPSASAYLNKEQQPTAEIVVRVDTLQLLGGHTLQEGGSVADRQEFSVAEGGQHQHFESDNDLPF